MSKKLRRKIKILFCAILWNFLVIVFDVDVWHFILFLVNEKNCAILMSMRVKQNIRIVAKWKRLRLKKIIQIIKISWFESLTIAHSSSWTEVLIQFSSCCVLCFHIFSLCDFCAHSTFAVRMEIETVAKCWAWSRLLIDYPDMQSGELRWSTSRPVHFSVQSCNNFESSSTILPVKIVYHVATMSSLTF